MKKEYLDMLYEQRSATQKEIDDLVNSNKKSESFEASAEKMDGKRDKLFMINQLIEQYIKIHA